MGTSENIYGNCIGNYLGTIWELFGNCKNTWNPRPETLPARPQAAPGAFGAPSAFPDAPWALASAGRRRTARARVPRALRARCWRVASSGRGHAWRRRRQVAGRWVGRPCRPPATGRHIRRARAFVVSHGAWSSPDCTPPLLPSKIGTPRARRRRPSRRRRRRVVAVEAGVVGVTRLMSLLVLLQQQQTTATATDYPAPSRPMRGTVVFEKNAHP